MNNYPGGIIMSDDYGYFGKGLTGYAHYNAAVESSKKSINGGGGGGKGGCLTSVIMAISVIAAVIAVIFVCIF